MVAPAPAINVRAECLRPCHTNPFGTVGWPAAVSLALAASIALAKCFRSTFGCRYCMPRGALGNSGASAASATRGVSCASRTALSSESGASGSSRMPALVLGVSSTSPSPRLICSLVTTWSEASARLTAAWRHVVPAGDADLAW